MEGDFALVTYALIRVQMSHFGRAETARSIIIIYIIYVGFLIGLLKDPQSIRIKSIRNATAISPCVIVD